VYYYVRLKEKKMMPFNITPKDTQNKAHLLRYFRERGNERLSKLRTEIGNENYKKLASGINKEIVKSLDLFKEAILSKSKKDSWSEDQTLRSLLASTYCAQAAMLDLRNEVWPYEYMAFSRRIGELWEHFASIPFAHSITEINVFVPPLFSEVRSDLRKEIGEFIEELPLSKDEKSELLQYYEKVWVLVDSGEVSLQLDLHAEIEGTKVNIDFKSGFGSNEKGNTNRLLMVATVYQNLEDNYNNVLLVRAQEDQNNHYFQTLKRSEVWDAFCGTDAYDKIGEYTGFDLKGWIQHNINWKTDLLPETMRHFTENNLTQYLEW
jgi:hypothetical protein